MNMHCITNTNIKEHAYTTNLENGGGQQHMGATTTDRGTNNKTDINTGTINDINTRTHINANTHTRTSGIGEQWVCQ